MFFPGNTILGIGYCVLAVAATYLCISLAYYVVFHPITSFPGPFLAKLSGGYNGYYALKRQLHLRTWQNHLKYGSVVRQGPNKLVFSSVEALRDIYKKDLTTKPRSYIALGPRLNIPTVFTAQDRHIHRTRRQLIGQSLSKRSMRIFKPTMLTQVDQFLKHILNTTQLPDSSSINMTERARLLGFDLASLLAFGYDMHLQTSTKNGFVLPFLELAFYWSSIFIHWPLARRFGIGLLGIKDFRRLVGQYLPLVEHIIRTRTEQDKNAHHDFYSIVADDLDKSGSGTIRSSELWAEATSFLPAAGDTTNTALAAVFFYLSRNPTCYATLAREIRSNFATGSEIRSSAVTTCPYLRACIDEALRMSPPVPGILWREAYAGVQPFVGDGHVILPGTIVGVNVYSLHFNAACFQNPFEFCPERWLVDDTKTIHDAFMPFSTGPRGCAGKAMAYLEVSLVLAKTMWYFDFQMASEQPEILTSEAHQGSLAGIFELLDSFTSTHRGPMLTFKQRGNFCQDLRSQIHQSHYVTSYVLELM
ncbi:cytochrome P450 [Xylariaceae sp. FL0255]|nr:cytochrome P450 [Xylariaceae sp. FL0255]